MRENSTSISPRRPEHGSPFTTYVRPALTLSALVVRRAQPPHQFKTFKFDTPEAKEGRKQVKDLGDDVKAHEKKIKVRTGGERLRPMRLGVVRDPRFMANVRGRTHFGEVCFPYLDFIEKEGVGSSQSYETERKRYFSSQGMQVCQKFEYLRLHCRGCTATRGRHNEASPA